MSNENEEFNKEFYKTLEKGIGELPQNVREKLYRSCAENCVKRYVLGEQQRQFNECGGDFDLQCEKYGNSEYFFAEIIEKGHIYGIGYPVSTCLCPMVSSKMTASKIHCECSRQSMLYVLETLMPNKNITVETVHTVLSGANECRFHVVIE